ncbi:hypothetical protein FA13DRAFT_938051 [Coprinellus micaceus]|uniref:F-box domain-containing protein n=1 Tax=Coprinellus micaceus TaxID=71717 RepID=A0A4Y7T012_COPMI|nr:hypothetical protein FA13DRAFT_938051 [Coprinellus micaceus]
MIRILGRRAPADRDTASEPRRSCSCSRTFMSIPGPRCSLTTLPLEIISLVVKNLESTFDVVHFEQTNRTCRSLVKGSLDIWKHRLRLECHLCDLWWPSYADLSTIAELRDVCFAGLRMARAYSLAGHDTLIPHEMTRLNLRFKPSETESGEFNTPNSRGGIQSVQLVPGGRYLIVLYPGCGRALWIGANPNMCHRRISSDNPNFPVIWFPSYLGATFGRGMDRLDFFCVLRQGRRW